MSRLPTILIAAALATVALAGCGEEGAAEGAVLRVYVSVPLHGAEAGVGRPICAEARREARLAGRPGGFELRVVCLDVAGPDGRWTLARVGANARRATEDSTTVAYVGEPTAGARRHSRPIVEAAGIAALGDEGGEAALATVVGALEEGWGPDPRRLVFDTAGG